jgi:hypothetical protein
MTENRIRFLEMVCAYGRSQVVYVATQLRLAEHMNRSAMTSAELAELTTTHPAALHRLLCALANLGIVDQEDNGLFALTMLGRECLASESLESLEPLVRYLGHPTCQTPWAHLLYSIKTGQPAFAQVYGTNAWKYRANDPELNSVFNAAMQSVSREQADGIASRYDFTGARCIVDVGGGSGALLAGILSAYPEMHGVLFDLPHVVSRSSDVLSAAQVTDRCQVLGGDFFESVPPGGDVYLMRAVVHDWDDESAVKILDKCRLAMSERSRLLLVEMILRTSSDLHGRFWPSFLDLHMLVTLGGRQRSVDEFARLLALAKFRLTKVISLPGHYDMVEGEPV